MPALIYSQTSTYFYKLTKQKINGVIKTNVNGGQFFTFTKNSCYESNNEGYSVDNGILKFCRKENNLLVYVGNTYYGNSVVKVKEDYSKINIYNDENIYVYEHAVPSLAQTTCTLIKQKQIEKIHNKPVYTPININACNNITTNADAKVNIDNGTAISKQKTKVRKKCAYCSGKGERIQHESISTFVLSGPRVYCNICNQSWSYGTVHAHHRCNHCNGTGYYEYEY